MRWTKEYAESQKKIILEVMRKSNLDIAKVDVIKATGWNRKTVDRYMEHLIKDGKITKNRNYGGKLILYRLTKRKNLKLRLYKVK